MNVIDLKDWLGAAALLISVGGALYAWVTRDSSKALSRLEALSKDVSTIEKRVSSIESELKHAPTKEDLDELKERLSDLSREVAVSNTSMAGMRRVLDRVDEWITRGGAK